MTLQQLEYALVLQQYCSFNQAAKQLGISQPALSVQIKKLEGELGLILFDRSQKKVSITQKGEVFLDRAKLLLNESKQLFQIADQLKDQVTGELRIGIIPTLAPYLLPLFIEELQEKFTQLKVYIKEALTDEIIQDLKTGVLDGGIISTPISSNIQLADTPLFYEGFKLFVSHEHPLYNKSTIGVTSIPPEDIWLLREGNCFRDQIDNICEISKRNPGLNHFHYESNSIESLCRIVEFKGGITFLPELSTMHLDSDREDMIKELSGAKRVREISLVHLPNHVRLDDLTRLGQVIKNNLPKSMLAKGKTESVPTNVKIG